MTEKKLTREERQAEVLGWISRKLLWLSDNQHRLRREQIQAVAKQLGKVARTESAHTAAGGSDIIVQTA